MSLDFSFWQFNPRSVPGMAHWFSADYGVTDDGGGRAATVLDRSGNGRTLTGGGGAANPVRGVGGPANRPLFTFTVPAASVFTYAGFNPSNTFFTLVALKQVGAGSNSLCWNAVGPTNHQICDSAANAGIKCFDSANLVISNAQDISTIFGLIEVKLNAGTMSAWYNGTALGMTTAAGLGVTMTVGTFGQVAGVAFSNMSVHEAMMFTTLPSATQQLQLREYFRSKYNLF